MTHAMPTTRTLAALFLAALLASDSGMPRAALADQRGEVLLLGLDAVRERPAVAFPHEAHQELIDCHGCHHNYARGQNLWTPGDPTACADCHKAKVGRDGLRWAYHRQCLGCHQRTVLTERKAVPVTCGACHKPAGSRP